MAKTSRVALATAAWLSSYLVTSALAETAVPPPNDAGAKMLVFGWVACLGLALLIGFAGFIFWLVMLIDCFKRENDEFPKATENTKTIWIVVLLVSWLAGMYWLAALLYFFLVRRAVPRRNRV